MRTERLVLTGMAALFAAMLGRVGWVDWPAVAASALGVAWVLMALVVPALLLFLVPALLLTAAVRWIRDLFDDPAARSVGAPPASPGASSPGAPAGPAQPPSSSAPWRHT